MQMIYADKEQSHKRFYFHQILSQVATLGTLELAGNEKTFEKPFYPKIKTVLLKTLRNCGI